MNDEERKNHCYLGDAVYAEYDGCGVILRTGSHRESECEQKIYIEMETLNNLMIFLKTFREN